MDIKIIASYQSKRYIHFASKRYIHIQYINIIEVYQLSYVTYIDKALHKYRKTVKVSTVF